MNLSLMLLSLISSTLIRFKLEVSILNMIFILFLRDNFLFPKITLNQYQYIQT